MGFLKKNGFWISSFLLVAAMIGTWFYATGDLQAKMDKRISAINSSDQKAQGIMGVEAEAGTKAHPNDQTEKGMNEKIDKLSESVLAAWQKRYDSQQKIMQWPTQILPAVFVNEFNQYHPPELLPAEEKGESVKMKNLLLVYKQQIPNQMKNICSVIKTRWSRQEELDEEADKTEDDPEEEARKAAEEAEQEQTGSGNDDDEDIRRKPKKKPAIKVRKPQDTFREIVRWSETNQDLWFQKLTQFNGRDDNQFSVKLPSPSQVYMLQQDLWLLEAMFEIVREVNAQLDENGQPILDDEGMPKLVLANDLAPVKEIDHVVFGREALASLGEITDTAAKQQESSPGGRSRGRGRGGPGRGGSKASDLNLAYYGKPAFHGRYVNKTFEPIESDKIRTVVGSKKLPANDLELLVAKRVPVRLAVQMDEREIPRFLAACANSPFAFEVWQVRINRHEPGEVIKIRGGGGADTGGRGGRGRGGRGRGSDRGDMGSGEVRGSNGGRRPGGGSGVSGGGGRNSRKGVNDVVLRKNYDVGVEFYGVVKIYNPPNEELLIGAKAEGASP